MIKVAAQSGNVKTSLHFDFNYSEISDIEITREALDLLMDQFEDLVKEYDCGICGTHVVLEYSDHGELTKNIKADELKVRRTFQNHLNECETRAQKRNKLQEAYDELDQKRCDAINGEIEPSPFQVDRLLEEMDELQEQIDDLLPKSIKKEREEFQRSIEYNEAAAMRGNKINIA